MKKLIALAVVAAIALGALLMTGCSGVDSTKVAVCFVVGDKFGDESYADAAKPVRALLEQEFYIQTAEPVECGSLNIGSKIKEAADVGNIIIYIGTDEGVDLAEIAAAYPDDRFIWIGSTTASVSPNAMNLVCQPEETGDAIYEALRIYCVDGNGDNWGTTWTYAPNADHPVPTIAPTEAGSEAPSENATEAPTEETPAE